MNPPDRKTVVSSGYLAAAFAAAMIVAVVVALGGCTTNNFNCNVKDACRPVTGAPTAGIAIDRSEA